MKAVKVLPVGLRKKIALGEMLRVKNSNSRREGLKRRRSEIILSNLMTKRTNYTLEEMNAVKDRELKAALLRYSKPLIKAEREMSESVNKRSFKEVSTKSKRDKIRRFLEVGRKRAK